MLFCNFLSLIFKIIIIFLNFRDSCATDITNGLVAYWNFDDSVSWMNPAYGGQTTSVGNGTPTRDTSTKKFGSGSLYLNGNSHLKIDTPGEWLFSLYRSFLSNSWGRVEAALTRR